MSIVPRNSSDCWNQEEFVRLLEGDFNREILVELNSPESAGVLIKKFVSTGNLSVLVDFEKIESANRIQPLLIFIEEELERRENTSALALLIGSLRRANPSPSLIIKDLLLDALTDPDALVQKEAVFALGKLDQEAYYDEVEWLFRETKRSFNFLTGDLLNALGTDFPAELVPLTEERAAGSHFTEAILALGRARCDAAEQALHRLLSGESTGECEEAISRVLRLRSQGFHELLTVESFPTLDG